MAISTFAAEPAGLPFRQLKRSAFVDLIDREHVYVDLPEGYALPSQITVGTYLDGTNGLLMGRVVEIIDKNSDDWFSQPHYQLKIRKPWREGMKWDKHKISWVEDEMFPRFTSAMKSVVRWGRR